MNDFVAKVGREFNKTGLAVKKHSPEILIVAGVVGVVASAVMACKATKKVDEVIDEHKEMMDVVRSKDSTPNEVKKETTMVYANTGFKLAKLYGPSIVLGVASLTSIISSNQILRKRNAALAMSYAALDKGFKEYRQRVVDRFGDEVEKQIFYNIQPQEIEESIIDDKGKEKKIKKTVSVADPILSSPYARYFTRSNPNWRADDDYNMTFISLRQSYFNDVLKSKGHLTLNEVYSELGLKETKTGMVCGWIYDVNNPTGDNCVIFNTTEVYLPNEFDGSLERAIAIDFNVDGNIYDMMK